MALVTANTEASHYMMGFSNTYMPLNISARSSLREAMQTVSRLPFSGTNCSIPMQHALKNKIPVDVFVVYTDNETYAGNEHPVQSLKKYRDAMGRDAKLIVVGMTSTGFTIADPKDRGMLDVVGFSADAPAVMSTFAKR
jgi:60 kDa SS-A/Ro ribonucleoprotein